MYIKHAHKLGILIAVVFFCIQALLVPHVGMSWDEAASFFVGRANLKFWTTGNRSYLNDLKNKELFQDSPIQYIYGEDIYPPFPFLVASSFSYILAEKMHVMNVLTAHHLGELALAACGIAALFGLAIEAGLTIPIAAGITLIYASYPTIADLMRNDAKDAPLVSMIIIASYFCLKTIRAWRERHISLAWRNGIFFAIAFGLAECTKPTAILLVLIVFAWLVIASVWNHTFRKSLEPLGPFLFLSSTLLLVSVAVFIFAWPWLWENPVEKLLTVWSFFKTVGYNMPTPLFGTMYHAGINVPLHYPLVILLIQTPIELSILACLGMVWAIYGFIRKTHVIPFLFVVWFLIGLGRFLIPGMIIYSRIRHFIDIIPACIVLAGFGVVAIINIIQKYISKKKYTTIIVYCVTLGVVIIHQIVIMFLFFPYESQYYNMLVGGTKTVAEKQLFDVGPIGAVKEAVEFINRDSAGEKTRIYPCLLGHIALFYTAPNVTLTSDTAYGNYTFVPNNPSWFDGAVPFGMQHHTLVYTVKRNGADLLYVFKYTEPIGWSCGWETRSNYVY